MCLIEASTLSLSSSSKYKNQAEVIYLDLEAKYENTVAMQKEVTRSAECPSAFDSAGQD